MILLFGAWDTMIIQIPKYILLTDVFFNANHIH